MTYGEIKTNEFNTYIQNATNKLKDYEYEESYKLIMKAIFENPNAPEPHNLLGIWYELNGMKDYARKHYRVGYVLDPLYKPSSVNLERVSTLFLIKDIPIDYGNDAIDNVTETKDKK